MEKLLQSEFYHTHNFTKYIKNILDTNYRDNNLTEQEFNELIEFRDPIVIFYILKIFKDKIPKLTNNSIFKLSVFIKNFKKYSKFKCEEFNKTMVNLILTKTLQKVDIDAFFLCISSLKLDNEDLDRIKKIFGYFQIYKYSKEIFANILEADINERLVGYILMIVDNPQLCYKHLLPLFKRINHFVKNVHFDGSIFNVCVALNAIFKYSPETLGSKKEFISSLFIFLSNILYKPDVYMILGHRDFDIIFETLDMLIKEINNKKQKTTLITGCFEKAQTKLVHMCNIGVILLEDVIFCCNMITLLTIFLPHVKSKTCQKDLIDIITNINIRKPTRVDIKQWKHVYDTVIYKKYKLIEYLIDEDFHINTDVFMRDFEKTFNTGDIMENLSDMAAKIDWSAFIPLVCSPEKRENFIIYMLSDSFISIEKEREFHYIIIYLNSLIKCDDLSVKLYLITRLMGLSDIFASNIDIINILARMYIFESDLNSTVNLRIKTRIVEFMIKTNNLSQFTNFVLDYCNENSIIDVLSLLIMQEPNTLDDSTALKVKNFLIISNNVEISLHEKIENMLTVEKSSYFMVAALGIGCSLNRKILDFTCFPISKFQRIIIGLISFIHHREDKHNFMVLEDDIIDFLFEASEIEKQEVNKIYHCYRLGVKNDESKYLVAYFKLIKEYEHEINE